MKESCSNCIHKEVCSIYELAQKENNQRKQVGLKNIFTATSMRDVCNYYKIDLMTRPTGFKQGRNEE